MHQQRHAGLQRAPRHRDRHIDPAIQFGKRAQHREIDQLFCLIRHRHQEIHRAGAVAGGEEQPGGANHLLRLEAGLLGVGRPRFRHRLWRRVIAEFVRRELAVERRAVFGPYRVPFRRQIGVARVAGGAAGPVRRPSLDIGIGRTGDDAGEMVERGPRLVAEAQRDIAGEELSLGIFVIVAGQILSGEAIRRRGVAGSHQPAGQDEPLLPIRCRMC